MRKALITRITAQDGAYLSKFRRGKGYNIIYLILNIVMNDSIDYISG